MVTFKHKSQGRNLLDKIDFILQFSQEKKLQNGEDANVFSANRNAVLIGVFDGCGGAGARQHISVGNKTSAYLASRIVAGIVRNCFLASEESIKAEEIRDMIYSGLHQCYSMSRMCEEPTPRMINRLAKTLPTTAAFAICREENGLILADCYWAGDSRLYLLDEDGLAQISVDDLNTTDAMENLYIGGKMTNVIHLPKDGEERFSVHHTQLKLKKPGILFAATDGCFDYITSPMEYEYLLLETLCRSRNINEWEESLKNSIGKVAQDDSSMTAAAFGYGTFKNLRCSLLKRKEDMWQMYISKMDGLDKEQKSLLWQKYRENYYRL